MVQRGAYKADFSPTGVRSLLDGVQSVQVGGKLCGSSWPMGGWMGGSALLLGFQKPLK